MREPALCIELEITDYAHAASQPVKSTIHHPELKRILPLISYHSFPE